MEAVVVVVELGRSTDGDLDGEKSPPNYKEAYPSIQMWCNNFVDGDPS